MSGIIDQHENALKQPLVCIILVTYDNFLDTVECIESIKKITYSNYKIIVVDNGSPKKPTEEQLKYISENADYLLQNENGGFSAGNNAGIQYARKYDLEYVLLLNNDTIVTPDFLDKLIGSAESHQDTGVEIGKIYYYDMPELLWFAGGWYDRATGMAGHRGWQKTDVDLKSEDKTKEITFATGCMMLIPMKVIEEVGPMSEEYFLYAEDTDYCCKIMDAGYHLYYCEDSVIYHKVSRSTSAQSELIQYYMTRNDLILIHKFGTARAKAYLQKIYYDVKNILRGRKKFTTVLRAWIAYLRHEKGRNKKY